MIYTILWVLTYPARHLNLVVENRLIRQLDDDDREEYKDKSLHALHLVVAAIKLDCGIESEWRIIRD